MFQETLTHEPWINQMTTDSIRSRYDALYQDANAFHYRAWVYRPYVRALLKKARTRLGGLVLDAGCGQGQFSEYIAETGRAVLGSDLSETGIEYARSHRHLKSDIKYVVGNPIDGSSAKTEYLAVFCRSFSPYNTADFSINSETTRRLLELVRPGGCLIWCYASRLLPQTGQEWRWHTVAETRKHFSSFDAKVYFTLRIECRILGRYAFNRPMSWLAEKTCRLFGIGGDLVAIVRSSKPFPSTVLEKTKEPSESEKP
jgi:SAM-dependent methyltransferase